MIWVLQQLNTKTLYLERYHCCETLFHILKKKDEALFRDIAGTINKINVKKKNAALKKLQEEYALEI